jgi:hypothetical protein
MKRLPSSEERDRSKLWILLFLALNFVIAFAVYQLFLRAESMIGTYVYLGAALVLTLAYCIVNRGFGRPISDPAALPDEWSAEEKSAYIADAARRHEIAKKLLYVLFPVVVVLMIDMIQLFVLPSVAAMFGG